MLKNLLNRTIINYVLVTLGTLAVSKGLIPGDIWEVARGGIEEALVIGLSGGGVIAIAVGAARGILDASKDKVVVDGQVAVLPKPGERLAPMETIAAKQAVDKAGDRLVGKVK